MKTIKIIDLLMSYANGEKQPRKIKFGDKEYIYNGNAVLQQLLDDYNIGILNHEIEILDEEDEFEDIEEIIYPDLNKDYEFELHHKHIEEIYDTINQLIKNQKKIIERLKEE